MRVLQRGKASPPSDDGGQRAGQRCDRRTAEPGRRLTQRDGYTRPQRRCLRPRTGPAISASSEYVRIKTSATIAFSTKQINPRGGTAAQLPTTDEPSMGRDEIGLVQHRQADSLGLPSWAARTVILHRGAITTRRVTATAMLPSPSPAAFDDPPLQPVLLGRVPAANRPRGAPEAG